MGSLNPANRHNTNMEDFLKRSKSPVLKALGKGAASAKRDYGLVYLEAWSDGFESLLLFPLCAKHSLASRQICTSLSILHTRHSF
jgi:hypothetical protein